MPFALERLSGPGTVHEDQFYRKNTMEQITETDRNACHALRRKANPAPRYGGFYISKNLLFKDYKVNCVKLNLAC